MKLYIYFILNVVFLMSCSSSTGSNTVSNEEWLIPKDEIRDGGPGKDGIPALEDLQFLDAANVSYLDNSDLVLVVQFGNDIRIYPHDILDWHEIINDKSGDRFYSVTYCPLTGSGLLWNRDIGGQITTFGVSGLLYNSNLIPYDRQTQSNWSQMKLKSVNGPLAGKKAQLLPMVEIPWILAKSWFPLAKVVSTQTGYSRPYGSYPYGDYKTNHNNLLFSVKPDDSRLPRKERVYGVIQNEKALVLRLNQFTASHFKQFNFEGEDYVAFGDFGQKFIVVYKSRLADGTLLTFKTTEKGLPAMAEDGEGNVWNIMGYATMGPRSGERLLFAEGFMGYWFAWGAFWPAPQIMGL